MKQGQSFMCSSYANILRGHNTSKYLNVKRLVHWLGARVWTREENFLPLALPKVKIFNREVE